MKLKSAKAYAVATPPPNLGGMFYYFVRLETDNGLVGWGEWDQRQGFLVPLHDLQSLCPLGKKERR